VGYYGVDARLMSVVGIQRAWPNAQEAYNDVHPILTTEPYYGYTDLALRAGWAVMP
jgi:hypothetical protein